MRKQASGECRAAFYTAKAVWDGMKREIEPEAEFLRRHKVVEMEITHGTVTFVLMAMAVHTEMLCFFFMGVVMAGLRKVLVAKSMKRLISRCKEHNSHKGQVEYGELSFHYGKGK
jgi:hypothetical protein